MGAMKVPLDLTRTAIRKKTFTEFSFKIYITCSSSVKMRESKFTANWNSGNLCAVCRHAKQTERTAK
jgi:hypothetical protein